jgi:DNA-binding transcriptional LysR family regulator
MNTPKIDLNLMQVFDALMHENNLTRAGFRLGLSQPAMSHALAKLRKLTGDPLFVRVPSGMEPTDFALKIGPSVDEGLKLLMGAVEGEGPFEPLHCDRIFQILMSDIGELVFLPRLINRLAKVAPKLDLRVLQLPREAYQDALASGEADLAIGFLPALKTGVYQQRLFTDTHICLVRADHPRIKKGLSLTQFSNASHVVIEPPGSRLSGHSVQTSTTSLLERHLSASGITRRVVLRVPHFTVVPAIVQQTDLITTLPSYVLSYTRNLPNLKTFKLPFEVPSYDIKQFWHERKHKDPANRWLRNLVSELFTRD